KLDPAPAGFPFCDGLKKFAGDPTHPPKLLSAGTTLYSGPPVDSAIGCYKYTFKVGGQLKDPHIIITDPPGYQARQSHGQGQPVGPDLPKCDFEHRPKGGR